MIEVVVTSHKRLRYLTQCIVSLRLDHVRIIVVDDSQDPEIKAYVNKVADVPIIVDHPISADEAKNLGIEEVKHEVFILTADDIVFSKGYSSKLHQQIQKLNQEGLGYSFMACNTERVSSIVSKWVEGWNIVNGVEMVSTGVSQVLGAVLHKSLWQQVGYFPIYGMSGQGDIAFSNRLHKLKIECGYFRAPLVTHLGTDKFNDYPDYASAFKTDEDKYRLEALEDTWEVK